jgi:predicted NBD/HSP70 family sugar kinase
LVTPAKPSLNLLRSLTDEHVLRALVEQRRLTRAELAVHTGISKPTISESVRRLCAAGLVEDTGERTTGRGRVGSYFALADSVGAALVVSVAPEGVVVEALDVHGEVLSRMVESVERPARPTQIIGALQAAARRVRQDALGGLRLAVVSAADPVERATGRLVHLPDAPFLVGELSPVDVLAGIVEGPVLVDNDVNWAARAERAAGDAPLSDFAYLHLGEGLGCAVVNDGLVRRGHRGLVGEIAHVVTAGPRHQAISFIDLFGVLGLRHPGTTAIDVDGVRAVLRRSDADGQQVVAALSRAVCGVLGAVVAFADPELVVLGGSWGTEPVLVEAIGAEFGQLARNVPIRATRLTDQPALVGARNHALHELRDAVIGAPRLPVHPGYPAGHPV